MTKSLSPSSKGGHEPLIPSGEMLICSGGLSSSIFRCCLRRRRARKIEDAVIIVDDDEGFIIEEKVVDEGEDGVGIGIGEDGEDVDDLDDGGNAGDVSKESVDTGRKVVGNPVIDADEEE